MLIPHLGLIDNLYASIRNHLSRGSGSLFFSQGWGEQEAIADVKQRIFSGLGAADIDVGWESDWSPHLGYVARDGYFDTPFFRQHLPEESRTCHFRLILPEPQKPCPVYVHMATTGEEGYAAREAGLAIPLLQRGCGSLILEHPYLGRRRPARQASTRLGHVADLLLLGGAAVEEARALLHWLRNRGYVHLGITGVSIGGHLAALTGALTPFDIAIVPCVAPHSAVPIFTEGLMMQACDWRKLSETENNRQQARLRLRRCLHFTGIEQFPPPKNCGAVIAIAALDDRFVPLHSTGILRRHWPGAQFRWVKGGHVSSILGQKKMHQSALFDAMACLQELVPPFNEVTLDSLEKDNKCVASGSIMQAG